MDKDTPFDVKRYNAWAETQEWDVPIHGGEDASVYVPPGHFALIVRPEHLLYLTFLVNAFPNFIHEEQMMASAAEQVPVLGLDVVISGGEMPTAAQMVFSRTWEGGPAGKLLRAVGRATKSLSYEEGIHPPWTAVVAKSRPTGRRIVELPD